MNQKFTFLLCASMCLMLLGKAGTPTINGVLEASDGWGAAIGTGNDVAGWGGANAKKVYSTFDNNFVYFAAEFECASWQQFMFLVNTKPGGTNVDNSSWGRTMSFDHTESPDFIFRGDIAKGNYAEYHVWNGAMWTNLGTNVNAAGTEVVSTFLGTTNREFPNTAAGTLEIRVPRSMIGFPGTGDVQFIIGGDKNTHGCFDAIPDDNNGTSWDPPGNFTRVSRYINSVVLPAGVGSFTGVLENGAARLNWRTLTEANLARFGVERSFDARTWSNVGTITALNRLQGSSYQLLVAQPDAPFALYRLKLINKDGSHSYSQQVTLKAKSHAGFELVGNPTRGTIKVAIHQAASQRFTATLHSINGTLVSRSFYQHGGGSSVMAINATGLATGNYLLTLTNDAGEAQVLKVLVN
ncbi:MAG: hypothetical protein EAY75_14495 [Bacteroidetes bacterium]|nr:MAG: hypothetical protein EAY75_14495 [Bacteroidota bacterium]